MLTPIINRLVRLPATILLALIWCYQRALSPVLGKQCRFHPTCSHFACEAIVNHGACKGSLLAIWRICRCNPLCDGGIDPVPERFSLKQLLHSSPTSSHHNGSQT